MPLNSGKCEWTGTAQQGLFRVASMKLRCISRLSLIFVLRRGSAEERTFSVANVACRTARNLI